MSEGADKKPDGWVEPVNESLLRPPSFFGASPRRLVIAIYTLASIVCFIGAMNKSWTLAFVAIGTATVAQVASAWLTFIEPHWFDLLSEWLKSPQTKVDP